MSVATFIGHRASGAPSHTATEGTLYWDTTNNKLYVNNDGATGWTDVSGGGGGATVTEFLVSRATNQSIAGSSDKKVQLDNILIDDGDFDATTNYRHTPTVSGNWLYMWQVRWANKNGAGLKAQCILYQNGSKYARGEDLSHASNDDPSTSGSVLVNMNGSTDYVELFAFHDSGSNDDINGENSGEIRTWLAGRLVS